MVSCYLTNCNHRLNTYTSSLSSCLLSYLGALLVTHQVISQKKSPFVSQARELLDHQSTLMSSVGQASLSQLKGFCLV
jgi:hypothetical protein